MIKNLKQIADAFTHGGVFHSDDVFAAALLKMINPAIEIHRVMTAPEETDDSIVFDIGMGKYDHHQKDREVRPFADGYWVDKSSNEVKAIPYCSFGLLWRDYGRILCSTEHAFKKIDRDLVLPIDKADNGVAVSTLSNAIGQLNPAWNSSTTPDDMFDEAVCLATIFLKSYIERANAEADAEEYVHNSSVVDGKILILEKYVPWYDFVINDMLNVEFVVFPSIRGGYSVQTVPNAPNSRIPRKPLPTEWYGSPDESLGMFFCHPGGVILSCHTQEQAIGCAKIAAERTAT